MLSNDISLILQAVSLEILLRDYNNSDLMQELQTQDEKDSYGREDTKNNR